MAENVVGKIGVELDTSSWPRDVAAGFNRAQAVAPKIRVSVDAAPLGRITSDLREFDKSLGAANARVIAFGATTGVLYSIAAGFHNLVSATINVEKQLTGIQAVLHTTSAGFAELKSSIFEIAKDTGSTFDQVAEAATNFSRQGLSLNETLKRTHDTMLLVRQSGLGVKEAIEVVASSINEFQTQAIDSTTAVNKLINVGNSFAVTSSGLGEALSKSAAAANEAGVGFDQLIAIITSLQQTTGRSASTVSLAFRNILNRTEKNATLEQLDQLGIRVKDLADHTLPAVEIFKNLAAVYDTLSPANQRFVNELTGGVRQMDVFKALLSDVSKENGTYSRALQLSLSTTDEAAKRNEELNTTLAALINRTKESGQALASAFGTKAIEPGLKSLFQTVNTLFESVGKLQGQDSVGAKIGSGIIDGIGTALKGPGTVVISALLFSIFGKVLGKAGETIGELTGLNKNARLQEETQTSINRALSAGTGEYRKQYEAATTVKERHDVILKAIQAENAALEIQRGLYAQEAAALLGQGIRPTGGSVPGKGRAFEASHGYIPNADSGLLPSIIREKMAVQRGAGGAFSTAQPVVVPNFNFGGGRSGPIVANNNEYIVKNFVGGQGSAVFNPQMINQVGGFNNLLSLGRVERIASEGYVPSFAKADSKMQIGIPEGMIEEGLHTEYPDVANLLEQYTHFGKPQGIYSALEHPRYAEYHADLQRLLKHSYGSQSIPVSRIEGYGAFDGRGVGEYVSVSTNPNWGASKPGKVKKYSIDYKDVVAAGGEAEGELIVKRAALIPMSKTSIKSFVKSGIKTANQGFIPSFTNIGGIDFTSDPEKFYTHMIGRVTDLDINDPQTIKLIEDKAEDARQNVLGRAGRGLNLAYINTAQRVPGESSVRSTIAHEAFHAKHSRIGKSEALARFYGGYRKEKEGSFLGNVLRGAGDAIAPVYSEGMIPDYADLKGRKPVEDYLVWEPQGDLAEYAKHLNTIPFDKDTIYRGGSEAELLQLLKGKTLKSDNRDVSKKRPGTYFAIDPGLAGRFTLRNARDTGSGFFLEADKNKIDNLTERAEALSTPHVSTEAIKRILLYKGGKVQDVTKKYLSNLADGLIPDYAETYTPFNFNLESFFGTAAANIKGKTADLGDINTFVRGQGHSKFVYEDLVKALKEKGVNNIQGSLIPQQRNLPRGTSPVDALKALYPQIIRGRFGKASVLGIGDKEFHFTKENFDEQLIKHANSILEEARKSGAKPPYLTSYLAGGFMPERILKESDILQRHPQKMFSSLSELTLDNLKAMRAKSYRFYKSGRKDLDIEDVGQGLDDYQLYDREIKKRLKAINAPILATGFMPDYASHDPKDLKGFANFGPPPEGYVPWRPTEEEVAKIKAGGRITKAARWDNMNPQDRFDILQKHTPNVERNRKLAAKGFADLYRKLGFENLPEFSKGFVPNYADAELPPFVYHVTFNERLNQIRKQGLVPQKGGVNTGQFGQDIRQHVGNFVFDNPTSALGWAFRTSFNNGGKAPVSILKISTENVKKLSPDSHWEMMDKGSFVIEHPIDPSSILATHTFDMAKDSKFLRAGSTEKFSFNQGFIPNLANLIKAIRFKTGHVEKLQPNEMFHDDILDRMRFTEHSEYKNNLKPFGHPEWQPIDFETGWFSEELNKFLTRDEAHNLSPLRFAGGFIPNLADVTVRRDELEYYKARYNHPAESYTKRKGHPGLIFSRNPPIDFQDLPSMLYHVTKDKQGIAESGEIRALKDAGGMGGGQFPGVSTTFDRKTALAIKRDFQDAVRLINSAKDEQGLRRGIQDFVKKYGMEPDEKTINSYIEQGQPYAEKRGNFSGAASDILNHLLYQREAQKNIKNPLFFDATKYYGYDPENIGIVGFSKQNIPREAATIFGSDHFNKEVRIAGSVPLKDRFKIFNKGFIPDYANTDKFIEIARKIKGKIAQYPSDEYIKKIPEGGYLDDPKIKAYYKGKNQFESFLQKAVLRGIVDYEDLRHGGLDILQPSFKELGTDIDRFGQVTKLPERLFHVTTNFDAVKQSGVLKSRDELAMTSGTGLGGGPDDTVSFTTDRKIARGIQRSTIELASLLSGKRDPSFLFDRAKKGFKADRPFYDKFEQYARGNVGHYEFEAIQAGAGQLTHTSMGMGKHGFKTADEIKELGGVPIAGFEDGRFYKYSLPYKPTVTTLHNLHSAYSYAQEEEGGFLNPLFFTSDYNKISKLGLKDVRLLEGRPKFAADKGMKVSALGEYRVLEGKRVGLNLNKGFVPSFVDYLDPYTIKVADGVTLSRQSFKGETFLSAKEYFDDPETPWLLSREQGSSESRNLPDLLKIIKKDYGKDVYNNLVSKVQSSGRGRRLTQTEFPFVKPSYNPTVPRGLVDKLEGSRSNYSKELRGAILSGGNFLENVSQQIKGETGVDVSSEEALKMVNFRLAQPNKTYAHWLSYTGKTGYGYRGRRNPNEQYFDPEHYNYIGNQRQGITVEEGRVQRGFGHSFPHFQGFERATREAIQRASRFSAIESPEKNVFDIAPRVMDIRDKFYRLFQERDLKGAGSYGTNLRRQIRWSEHERVRDPFFSNYFKEAAFTLKDKTGGNISLPSDVLSILGAPSSGYGSETNYNTERTALQRRATSKIIDRVRNEDYPTNPEIKKALLTFGSLGGVGTYLHQTSPSRVLRKKEFIDAALYKIGQKNEKINSSIIDIFNLPQHYNAIGDDRREGFLSNIILKGNQIKELFPPDLEITNKEADNILRYAYAKKHSLSSDGATNIAKEYFLKDSPFFDKRHEVSEHRSIIEFLLKNKDSSQFTKERVVYGAAGQQRTFTYLDLINRIRPEDLNQGAKSSVPRVFENVGRRTQQEAEAEIEKRNAPFPTIPHLSKDTDKVKRLMSEYQLIEEGRAMGSCVGGYGDACRSQGNFNAYGRGDNRPLKAGEFPRSIILSTGSATAELNPNPKEATNVYGRFPTMDAAERAALSSGDTILSFDGNTKGWTPIVAKKIDAYQIRGKKNVDPTPEDLEHFRNYVRANRLTPGFAAGFIPSFNNPLQEAIQRESRYVDRSNIYVDQDSRLSNDKNPLGLLVANRRDEPSSGSQGVSRAIREGRNPQTYGAAHGLIPNFIDPDFLKELIYGDPKKKAPRYRDLSQNQRAARDRLAFDEAKKEGVYQEGMSGYAALKALEEKIYARFQPSPPAPLTLPYGAPRLEQQFTLGQGNPPVFTGTIPTTASAPAASTPASTRTQSRKQTVDEVQSASPIAYGGQTLTPEQARRITELLQNRGGSKNLTREIDKIVQETQQTFTGSSPLSSLGNKLLNEERVQQRRVEEERGKIGDFFAKERERTISDRFQSPLGKEGISGSLAALFSTHGGRLKRELAPANLSEQGQLLVGDVESTRRASILQRRSQLALGASFIAPPLIQGIAEGSGLNPESRTGRAFGGIIGGVSTGTSIAALAQFTKFGIGLGVVVGAFTGLKAITDNVAKSFETISKSIDESNDKRQTEVTAISTTTQAIAQFAEISQSGDKAAIARSQTQIQQLLPAIPKEFREQFINSAATPTPGNIDKLLDIQNRVQLDQFRNKRTGDIAKELVIRSDKLDVAPGEARFSGLAGNPFSNLAGTQRGVVEAFTSRGDEKFTEQAAKFGERLRYAFTTSGFGDAATGGGIGIQPVLSALFPGADALEKVKSRFQPARLSDTLKSINSIPLDTEALSQDKSVDLNQLRQSLKPSGGGNPLQVIDKVLKSAKVSEDIIKNVNESLVTYDEGSLRVVATGLISSAQQNQNAVKKIAATSTNLQKRLSDFININDDILKDVAHNFDIQSLKQHGQRALGLQEAQGLQQIAEPILSPQGAEGFRNRTAQAQVNDERITKFDALLTTTLGKFQIPDEALQHPQVVEQVARSSAALSRDPTRATQELFKIADALKEFDTKGGEKISDSIKKGGRELAREFEKAGAEFNIKDQEIKKAHELNLAKIQFEQSRTFLGGDFRKLPNLDLDPVIRGLNAINSAPFNKPIVSNLFNRETGQFERGQDFRAERTRTIQQAGDIGQLGGFLFQSGLLPEGSSLRGLFRQNEQIGASQQFQATIDRIKDLIPTNDQGLAGQIRAALSSPDLLQRAQQASVVQSAEKFGLTTEEAKANNIPLIGALQKVAENNDKLAADGLLGIDPLKQNTIELLNTSAKISDLGGKADALTQAMQEQTQAIRAGIKPPDQNTPPQPTPTETTTGARGFIPNFNAFLKEARDIALGVGGARSGDKPMMTHLMGLGPSVINSGESVVKDFLGSGKDAVFNRQMKQSFGLPLNLLGNASRGYLPNFQDDISDLYTEYGMRKGSASQPPKPPLPPPPAPLINVDKEGYHATAEEAYQADLRREGSGSDSVFQERLFRYQQGKNITASRSSDLFNPRSAPYSIFPRTVEEPTTFAGRYSKYLQQRGNVALEQEARQLGYQSLEERERVSSGTVLSSALGKTIIEGGSDSTPTPELASAYRSGRIGGPSNAQPYTRQYLNELSQRETVHPTTPAPRRFDPYARAGLTPSGQQLPSRAHVQLPSQANVLAARLAQRPQQQHILHLPRFQQLVPTKEILNPRKKQPLSRLLKIQDGEFPFDLTAAHGYIPNFADDKKSWPWWDKIKEMLFGKSKTQPPKPPTDYTTTKDVQSMLSQMDNQARGFIPSFARGDETRIRALIRQVRRNPSRKNDPLTSQISSLVGRGRSDDEILRALGVDSSHDNDNIGLAVNTYGHRVFEPGQLPSLDQLTYTQFSLPPVDREKADRIERLRANRGIYSVDLVHQRVGELINQYGSDQYSSFIKDILRSRAEIDNGKAAELPVFPNTFPVGAYDSFYDPASYYARGFMPNFNSAMNDAITRESSALKKRGVSNPANYIFAGYSNGILGVGNTIDEKDGLTNPNAGILQGVNRYLRAGKNPRSAGQVPNYASSEDSQTLVKAITDSMNVLTIKLAAIFEKPFFNATTTATPGSTDVRHSGNFRVDVNANVAGSGGVDQSIIGQLQAAIAAFKSDINSRLSQLESKNGQILTPPTIPSAGGGGILV